MIIRGDGHVGGADMSEVKRDSMFEELIRQESVGLQEFARTAFYENYQPSVRPPNLSVREVLRVVDMVASFREKDGRATRNRARG
jgi:hypothetical protein